MKLISCRTEVVSIVSKWNNHSNCESRERYWLMVRLSVRYRPPPGARPSAHLWYVYFLTNISANTASRILLLLSGVSWIQTFRFFLSPFTPSLYRLLNAATGAEFRDVYHILLTFPAAANRGTVQRWKALTLTRHTSAVQNPNRLFGVILFESLGRLEWFFLIARSKRFARRLRITHCVKYFYNKYG